MLWTEVAFSACLARHWPDHHWQYSWRMAWTSACVRAKGGTSSNYCRPVARFFLRGAVPSLPLPPPFHPLPFPSPSPLFPISPFPSQFPLSHPLSSPSLSLPSPSLEVGPLKIQLGGLGERCKLPQRGLGQSPSRNRIWCILASKSDIWWQ